MNYLALSILFLTFSTLGICQCPTGDFAINNQTVSLAGCIDQAITIENQSTNAISYEWDFCAGDMVGVPTGTLVSTLTSILSYDAIKIVKESDSQYYGFIPKQASGGLFRLNFGSDLSQSPTPESLGALGLAGSTDIEFISDGGIWYAIVASGNNLFRLKFSNGLGGNAASISAVNLGNFGGLIASVRGISLIKQGADYYVLATSSTLNTITIVKFAGSMEGATSSIASAVTGASQLLAINVYKECDTWYAITTSVGNNRLINIQLGTDLMNASNFQYATVPGVSIQSFGMDLIVENDQYYVLLATIGTPSIFYQLNFGNSVWSNSPTVINRGSLSGLAACIAMDFVMKDSQVIGFIGNRTNYQLHRINYPNSCSVSSQASSLTEPAGIVYSNNGIYSVELKAFDADGNYTAIAKSLEIGASPAAAFSSTMNCVGQDVLFSDNSVSGFPGAAVVEWMWDFAGLGNSSAQDPEFQFPSQGDYTINLSIKDSRGCVAALSQDVHIFSQNDIQPDFTFDPVVCSQGLELFTDASSFIEDEPESWIWNFNSGEGIYTTENASHIFPNSGSNSVLLTVTGISGCSYSIQKSVPTVEAPTISFALDPVNCEFEVLNLEATSTGEIVGYSWNLGDGTIVTGQSITHSYETLGIYDVVLSGEAANGCTSIKSANHQIFSAPQPDFNIDLPPFSCNGTPTQFNDLTPPLVDSNVESWLWDFNDNGATANTQSPTYTYALSGNYDVTLTVTSDQGCSGQLIKSVAISESPNPSIVHTAACVDTGVEFTASSAQSIVEWQWQIGDNIYFTENPSHVFNESGDFNVSLVVTGENGCMSSSDKDVSVAIPIDVDFTSSKKCVDAEAQFVAVTSAQDDLPSAYAWILEGVEKQGQTITHSFARADLYEVLLRVTSESGCIYSLNKAQTVVEKPLADFSFSPKSGPPPLSVQFTNTSANASNYLWRFNDAVNSTSTLVSPNFNFTEVGDYPVDLLASNDEGCEHTISKLISVALPFLFVSLDEFEVIQNQNGLLQMRVTVNNQGNVDLPNLPLAVSLNNGTALYETVPEMLSGGESKTVVLATSISKTPGLQFLCLTLDLDNNSAGATEELCLSLEGSTVFTAPHPNPANNSVTLEWVAVMEENVTLSVVNTVGKEMFTTAFQSQQGLNSHVLSTALWQEGLYFVKVQTAGIEHTFRIIIVR